MKRFDLLALLLTIVVHAGCASHGEAPPPVPCGDELCGANQICATITAGLTCDTGPGVPSFGVLRTYCLDVPASCGGEPTCECINGCSLESGEGRPCLDVFDNQSVSCGCF